MRLRTIDLRLTVEEDWSAQEKRSGRSPQSPEAIHLALQRVGRLLDSLSRLPQPPELRASEPLGRSFNPRLKRPLPCPRRPDSSCTAAFVGRAETRR
jgi:hypothetical protein